MTVGPVRIQRILPTASLFGMIPALGNTEVLMFRQERGLSLAILMVGIPAWGAVDTSALWRPLDDIASRDVFYGPGGKFDQPRGSFTFIEEDLNGTQPKFVFREADGGKWRLKTGP